MSALKSCLKSKRCSTSSAAPSSHSVAGAAASIDISPTSAPPGTPHQPTRPKLSSRRTVSFQEKDLYEVHFADDWDRSPVDVAAKLSYEDILELKQLQVSVARETARVHAASGSSTSSRFLTRVPVGLLPLLPDSSSSSNQSQYPSSCPKKLQTTSNTNTYKHPSPTSPLITPPDTPPKRMPLPVPPPPPTARARSFAFIPLLDSSSSPSLNASQNNGYTYNGYNYNPYAGGNGFNVNGGGVGCGGYGYGYGAKGSPSTMAAAAALAAAKAERASSRRARRWLSGEDADVDEDEDARISEEEEEKEFVVEGFESREEKRQWEREDDAWPADWPGSYHHRQSSAVDSDFSATTTASMASTTTSKTTSAKTNTCRLPLLPLMPPTPPAEPSPPHSPYSSHSAELSRDNNTKGPSETGSETGTYFTRPSPSNSSSTVSPHTLVHTRVSSSSPSPPDVLPNKTGLVRIASPPPLSTLQSSPRSPRSSHPRAAHSSSPPSSSPMTALRTPLPPSPSTSPTVSSSRSPTSPRQSRSSALPNTNSGSTENGTGSSPSTSPTQRRLRGPALVLLS